MSRGHPGGFHHHGNGGAGPSRPATPLPPSLYAETARRGIPAPPLDGDRRVDVAVVGAGLTGLSAALHLAQGGASVAVLDSHEPGWGASGRNGGQVNPGLQHDPDAIERDFGADLGGRMVAFSWGSPNVVFDLIRLHQIQCEARQGGTLRAATSERGAEAVRRSAEQCIRRGMPVALLEGDAVAAVAQTGRYGAAMLDRRGGSLNPLGYARGLAAAAVRAGAAIHGATPALGVARQGSAWAVRTPTGTVRAEKLVLATNAYSDDLWPKLRRSVVSVFSGIIATERLPAGLAERILPGGASLYESGQVTVYYRVDVNGRLLMGGRSPMRDGTTIAALRYLTRYTERLWPELKGVRWSHAWNGQLAVTPDHYPHLHEPANGVVACLGYNGRGVAMATAMGGEVARRVLGTAASDLSMPVTDLRAIPFHGLWRTAASARIVYGRVRGSLGL